MKKLYIRKTISIKVPVAVVWKVMVKKKYIKEWIDEFSDGNIKTEDWVSGSKLSMTDENGDVIMRGTITDFRPNKQLKIEFDESDYTEELILENVDSGTTLISIAGPVSQKDFDQHSDVWDNGLNKIKKLAESLNETDS